MARKLLKDILPSNRKQNSREGIGSAGVDNDDSYIEQYKEKRSSFDGGSRVLTDDDRVLYYSDDYNQDSNMLSKGYFNGEKNRKPVVWFLAVFSLLVLLLALSYVFSTAKIVVHLKSEPINIKTSFIAGTNDCNCEADVVFQTIKLEKIFEKTIPADSEKQVERKASGTIVIYNNYSSASQRLIKNTRFEAPNGLIYRIDNSVVVPGITIKDGQKVPGSVEVKVYADFAGAEYNIGLVDFTIPGFKNDPQRYANFYARSKTEMKGGFIGKVKTVSESKLKDSISLLKEEARQGIRQELDKLVKSLATSSEEVMFVPVELTGFYADEPEVTDTSLGDKSVILKQKVKGVAFALNEKQLNKRIIKALRLEELVGEELFSIQDRENLVFRIANIPSDYAQAIKTKELKIELNGSATLVFGIDEKKFLSDIKGNTKSKVRKIVETKYRNVEAVDVVFRPFWNIFPPARVDKIDLNVISK